MMYVFLHATQLQTRIVQIHPCFAQHQSWNYLVPSRRSARCVDPSCQMSMTQPLSLGDVE